MANANKITSGGDYAVIERDADASAAIKSGMLLDINSDNEFIKHATAGGNVLPTLVALPDMDHASVDVYASATAFSDGDRIQAAVCTPGMTGYLWLTVSQTITVDELLESAGDGRVRVYSGAQAVDEGGVATYTIYHKPVVARALEAKTTDGSTTSPIHVMFV